jgi:hypothetical protein
MSKTDVFNLYGKGGSVDTNISLSLELLCLINWLLKHEKPMINSMIKHAIKNGFIQDLERMDSDDQPQNAEQLYTSALDFLMYLEKNLIKNLEDTYATLQEEKLAPTMIRMDADNVDAKTMWTSMQQVKKEINKSSKVKLAAPHKHMAEDDIANVLFDQILKNWKPNQNEPVN